MNRRKVEIVAMGGIADDMLPPPHQEGGPGRRIYSADQAIAYSAPSRESTITSSWTSRVHGNSRPTRACPPSSGRLGPWPTTRRSTTTSTGHRVANLILDKAFSDAADPGANPADATVREWFSQPRPYTRKTLTPHRLIVGGDGDTATSGVRQCGEQSAVRAPQTWKRVERPSRRFCSLCSGRWTRAWPPSSLRSPPAWQVALLGNGLGSVVISRVYDELRSGTLQNRRSDLIGGSPSAIRCENRGTPFPSGSSPTEAGSRRTA